MTAFDIYVFTICLIVFILLTAFSSVALVYFYKSYRKLVELGAEDEALLKEHERNQQKNARVVNIIDRVVSIVMVVVVLIGFAFSIYVKATADKDPNGIPSLRIVQTDSMSYANEKNAYLMKNNIKNHLQVFDLVVVHHIPDEFALKLYDIVMYEVNDRLIIHRIIAIEEPNEKHPNERYFVLQGDAVEHPDKIPVYYKQMKGIYYGERVPFVGSFVEFLQSPAGWLCIALIVVCSIVFPITKRSLQKHIDARLISLGVDVTPQKPPRKKKEADE